MTSQRSQGHSTPTEQYEGFSMRPTIVGDRKVWTVKVTSGPYAGLNATVNRNQVPEWLDEFMDLTFELVTVGKTVDKKRPKLVAINVQPRVPQQQNSRTGEQR